MSGFNLTPFALSCRIGVSVITSHLIIIPLNLVCDQMVELYGCDV